MRNPQWERKADIPTGPTAAQPVDAGVQCSGLGQSKSFMLGVAVLSAYCRTFWSTSNVQPLVGMRSGGRVYPTGKQSARRQD